MQVSLRAVARLAGDGNGAHSQLEQLLVHGAGGLRSAQPRGTSRCSHRPSLDRGLDNSTALPDDPSTPPSWSPNTGHSDI